mmetsp:Transcript_13389/g.53723  ORF Transcript_13389/g.53723 Transcript_13389/m.53723 type:complete len:384 (+) Transcript_13389:2500-3651(+)
MSKQRGRQEAVREVRAEALVERVPRAARRRGVLEVLVPIEVDVLVGRQIRVHELAVVRDHRDAEQNERTEPDLRRDQRRISPVARLVPVRDVLPLERRDGEGDAVEEEPAVVVEPHRVADVRAVVVEGHDALAAHAAVLGSERALDVARVAQRHGRRKRRDRRRRRGHARGGSRRRRRAFAVDEAVEIRVVRPSQRAVRRRAVDLPGVAAPRPEKGAPRHELRDEDRRVHPRGDVDDADVSRSRGDCCGGRARPGRDAAASSSGATQVRRRRGGSHLERHRPATVGAEEVNEVEELADEFVEDHDQKGPPHRLGVRAAEEPVDAGRERQFLAHERDGRAAPQVGALRGEELRDARAFLVAREVQRRLAVLVARLEPLERLGRR